MCGRRGYVAAKGVGDGVFAGERGASLSRVVEHGQLSCGEHGDRATQLAPHR